MDMLEKVKSIIAETLNISADSLREDTNVQDDLGADSLELVEIAMAVEDEFEIEIDDEAIIQIHTIGDIVKALQDRLGA